MCSTYTYCTPICTYGGNHAKKKNLSRQEWSNNEYCDMTPERRKCGVRETQERRPLLDNDSLGTFPHQRIGLQKTKHRYGISIRFRSNGKTRNDVNYWRWWSVFGSSRSYKGRTSNWLGLSDSAGSSVVELGWVCSCWVLPIGQPKPKNWPFVCQSQ
jgi:hypothetical protein